MNMNVSTERRLPRVYSISCRLVREPKDPKMTSPGFVKSVIQFQVRHQPKKPIPNLAQAKRGEASSDAILNLFNRAPITNADVHHLQIPPRCSREPSVLPHRAHSQSSASHAAVASCCPARATPPAPCRPSRWRCFAAHAGASSPTASDSSTRRATMASSLPVVAEVSEQSGKSSG